MDNITRIRQNLVSSAYGTNPVGAGQDLAILAGEYAFIMGSLEEVLQRKPSIWNELRPRFKSDTACERAWEQTQSGLDEAGLKLRAKSVEKMMVGLRAIIRLAEADSSNKF